MKNKLKLSIILTTMVCSCLILAQTTELKQKKESVSEAIDYTDGIQRLEKFGFPNVAGAEYVEMESEQSYGQNDHFSIINKGWFIKDPDLKEGAPEQGTIILFGVNKIRVERCHDNKERALEENVNYQLTSYYNYNTSIADDDQSDSPIKTSWKKANIDKDIKKILKEFKKEENKKYFSDDLALSYFMFALHLYQIDRKNDADKIIESLLVVIKDKRLILIRILDQIANKKYYQALKDFSQDHNWQKLHDRTQQIMDRFKSTWGKRNLVKAFLPKLKNMANSNLPKFSEYDAMPPEEKKLAEQFGQVETFFLTNNDDFYRNSPVPWFLKSDNDQSTPTEKSNLEKALKTKGLEVIPFLLKLSNDKQLLTKIMFNDIASEYAPPFFPKSESDLLQRPATRGELALRILYEFIPRQQHESLSEEQIRSFPDIAMNFYKKFKNKGQYALAMYYLKTGTSPDVCTKIILKEAAKKPLPEYETFILGQTDIKKIPLERVNQIDDYQFFSLAAYLLQYIVARDSKDNELLVKLADNIDILAKEFSPKTKKKDGNKDKNVENKDEDLFIEDAETVRQKSFGLGSRDKPEEKYKRFKEASKIIRSFQFDRKPETILKELTKDNPLNSLSQAFIIQKLQSMDPNVAIGLILKAADQHKSVDIKHRIINLIPSVVGAWKDNDLKKLSPTANADLWLKLLEDKRKSEYQTTSLRHRLITLHEQLFAKKEEEKSRVGFNAFWGRNSNDPRLAFFNRRYNYKYRYNDYYKDSPIESVILDYGNKGQEFLIHRIKQRLKGITEDKLPEFPNTYKISEAELTDLEEKLSAPETREELQQALDSLSIYQLHALKDFLKKKPALNKKLAKLANYIAKININEKHEKYKALKERFTPWLNKPLTADLVKVLFETVKSELNRKVNFECCLIKQPFFQGIELRITPKHEYRSYQNYPTPPAPKKIEIKTVGIKGQVFSHDLYSRANWRFHPVPKKYKWQPLRPSSDKIIEDFWQAVTKFTGTDIDAASPGAILLLTEKDRLLPKREDEDDFMKEKEEANNLIAPEDKKPEKANKKLKSAQVITPETALKTYGKDFHYSYIPLNNDEALEIIQDEFKKAGIEFEESVAVENFPMINPATRYRNSGNIPKIIETTVTFDFATKDKSIFINYLTKEIHESWVGNARRKSGQYNISEYDFPFLTSKVSDAMKQYKTEKTTKIVLLFHPLVTNNVLSPLTYDTQLDSLLQKNSQEEYHKAFSKAEKKLALKTKNALKSQIQEILPKLMKK